ncbi:flagellar hook-length control protein FliK [Thiovibrio sp. JS02]
MKIGGPSPFKGVQQIPEGKNDPGKGVLTPARLLFAHGQLLKGEVLGFTPDGKARLAIGGQTVEAHSEVALKAGSSLWLEVKQEDPLWLGLADKKGAAQEFLRQYFADPSAMGRGLRALLGLAFQQLPGKALEGQADFLQNLAATAVGREADPGQLVRFLTMLGGGGSPADDGTSGLLPEKLHELLRLLDLAGGGAIPDKTTAAAMHRLGLLLELQNELNALPPAANQALFLLFPCFFALGAGAGQWLFTLDRDKEKGTGEQGYTLSFFLEMSRLGEVQVQIKVKGDALRGEFVVAGEAVKKHLEARLPELQDLFVSLGYGPVSLSCRAGKAGLIESLKKSVEEALDLEAVRLVDLRA